jgi:nucleotide-binding universal stress UspA family protein
LPRSAVRAAVELFARILYAHDGSDSALKAFAVALELANRCQAELHMICVEKPPRALAAGERPEADELVRQDLHSTIERAKKLAQLKNANLIIHHTEGRLTPTIAEFASERRYDLLVIGHAVYAAFYDGIIGSAAERLTRMAPCSVLIVK